MEKRNRKILIIGGILLVVVVLAVVFFIILAPKLSEQDILNNPSAAMTFCNETSRAQNDCYFKIAEVLSLSNSDVAVQACLSINKDDTDYIRDCVEEVAYNQTEQTKAIEICNSLENVKSKEHCYGVIMSKSSNLNVDSQLAICDSKTGADKDNCYAGTAESFLSSNASKSVEVCNMISDKSTEDNCLNNVIKNTEIVQANQNLSVRICDSLTLKSSCYSYVAQTISGIDPTKGVLICQKLSDETQMLNCYHNAWFDFKSVVLQNYDLMISLCNTLDAKRDECLRGASEIFATVDRTKAEEICRLASASTVEGCLHVVQTGH